VETAEELAFLRGYRCDEAQGYYFSPPVPALQFARLLETGIPAPAPAVPVRRLHMAANQGFAHGRT
jgi:predicted signal transduction protein with EAL and GGDEF domain